MFDSNEGINKIYTLKMKDDVDAVTGFLDIPP